MDLLIWVIHPSLNQLASAQLGLPRPMAPGIAGEQVGADSAASDLDPIVPYFGPTWVVTN